MLSLSRPLVNSVARPRDVPRSATLEHASATPDGIVLVYRLADGSVLKSRVHLSHQ